MIKADLPQLESLSRRLGTCSNDVADLKATLSGLISGTDWEGGAATRFRDAWDTQFRPALDEMATALTDASSEVNGRMLALDRAGN